MRTIVKTACGQVKDNNEDCFVLNDVAYYDQNADHTSMVLLAAVFDGVGGSNYGEVASQMAATLLARSYQKLMDSSLIEMEQVIHQINEALLQKMIEKPIYRGFATTIAGVVIQKDTLVTYNLGDSRIYRLRSGLLRQLSIDDTYFNLMKSMGRASTEDYHKYENSHVITAYLGKKDLEPDEIHVLEFSYGVTSGDIILICSDGVTDMCDDQTLETILSKSIPVSEKSTEIIEVIESNGSKDNYTFIMIEV